jgi:polysaccharide biosynthesis transport protein
MKDFTKLHPLDYLKILRRRWWYTLLTFILVGVAVTVYAWRMPDVYRSESRIMVESAVIAQDYVRPSIRSTPEEQIAAIRGQVQSRTFLEQMIQEFPTLGYGTNPKFSMDDTVRALNKNIEILNTSKNTFSISFSATNPELAQQFTQRMVNSLIQKSTSARKTRAVETDQFLDEQLRRAEQDLATHEEKIKQFKTLHLGGLPEQSAANLNALNSLSTQLVSIENSLQQARERQKLLEIRVQQQKRLNLMTQNILIPETPSTDLASNIPPVDPKLEAKQAELAALIARYTPNHPDVIRLSREVEELKKQHAAAVAEMTELGAPAEAGKKAGAAQAEIPVPDTAGAPDLEDMTTKFEEDSIKSEIANKEKEKHRILDQIKTYQSRLNLTPAIEQELMALTRERENLQKQYSNLQDKKFQSQMTANMETNRSEDTYTVIDPANLPERSSFPNRVQIIIMGLGAGFILGLGAALGREMLDTTLVGEEEASSVLNLPVLVSISEIPQKKSKKAVETGRMAKSA